MLKQWKQFPELPQVRKYERPKENFKYQSQIGNNRNLSETRHHSVNQSDHKLVAIPLFQPLSAAFIGRSHCGRLTEDLKKKEAKRRFQRRFQQLKMSRKQSTTSQWVFRGKVTISSVYSKGCASYETDKLASHLREQRQDRVMKPKLVKEVERSQQMISETDNKNKSISEPERHFFKKKINKTGNQ